MKISNKHLPFVALFVIVIVFLLVSIPYILMGPPSPLFSIRNMNDMNHEVSIEILTLNNDTIFKEKYVLSPQNEIKESKSISFLVRKTLPFDEKYVVNVTLDGNSSEFYYTELNRWETVDIRIDDGLTIRSMVS